jgi:LacI family transcriptional regulator
VALLLESSNEYARGLLRGILQYSRLHGPWSLYFAPGHLKQALPKADSWGGTGIIARIRSRVTAERIRATGLPFVASSWGMCLFPQHGGKFGEIRTDSVAVGRMGAVYLTELKLRHFAFCGFAHCLWSSRREKAFSQWLRDQGFQCHTYQSELGSLMHWPNWIEAWEDELPLFVQWLKSLPKPVGIMACNDVCGAKVLQACATAGLRVPDDVAVLGVDNDELICQISNPPLSSIALDLGKAGYEAAQLLDRLMSGHLTGEHVVQVEPVYVVHRQSSEPDDASVASALRFIRYYVAHAIGVADVVESVRVSRRTLERRFSRALGRSIGSEIIQRHLERAKQLLLETDLPSYRVAAESGFGSIKTFNRVFRCAAGVSPRVFRQNSKV